MDISKEIVFQTTRSGGKGGQNVNKVEATVVAGFHINGSTQLTTAQKKLLIEKLANRITASGFLQIKY